MASAAYVVVCHDVNVKMQIETLDELAVVAHHIIAYKAVKLLGDFILIKDSAYDSSLDGPSMASKKVAEGNNNISLFEVSICRRVSSLIFVRVHVSSI
jgi:hypothetical protein